MSFVISVHHTEPDVAWFNDGRRWAATQPCLSITLHVQAPVQSRLLHQTMHLGRPGRSVTQGQPCVAARVIGAVEAVLAQGLAAQRWRANQDRRDMVRRLRVAELVAHCLEQLA